MFAHVVEQSYSVQTGKKVVSDSPELVNFAIRSVNSVHNLPNRQAKFLRNSNYRRIVMISLAGQSFGG